MQSSFLVLFYFLLFERQDFRTNHLTLPTLLHNRLFLQGLDKYGRGDWRNISKLCVHSRTPTQVASHAQKYFKWMVVVDKRTKSSIHNATILDNRKIVTQQVQTTQLVGGASGDSVIEFVVVICMILWLIASGICFPICWAPRILVQELICSSLCLVL